MKYAILGSGSKANSYIFSNSTSSFILDNGYSFYQFSERAKKLDFDIKKIKFILVTHTHQDHIAGVKTCAKKLKIPIYINQDSDYLNYFNKEKLEIRLIETGKIYKHDCFSFLAFNTSHDSKGSVSYSINFEGFTFTVITDTGKITNKMTYLAKNSDILFLEANYNETMLIEGPYPLYLKQRIQSDKGHLSNLNAINFLNYLSEEKSKIKLVYFCHMSEVNNNLQILKDDIERYGRFKFKYFICPRNELQNGINIDDILIKEDINLNCFNTFQNLDDCSLF